MLESPLAVRWYARFRLSYADAAEWLAERGFAVDRSAISRWVQRFLPLFAYGRLVWLCVVPASR